MAEYDINNVVSPKAIKDIEQLEKETEKVVTNILKIYNASAKLDSQLGKLKGDSVKKLNTVTKKAVTNNEKLKTSTIKLTNLQTNYMKTLTALAKQKERETKKTAEQIKHEKDLAIVNSRTAGTLERLAAENRILRREKQKLDLESEKGIKRNKEINRQLDANNKFIKENADALTKQKIGIGGYQEAIENAIPALRGVGGAIKSVTRQLKLMLANPVVLVMAAIVGAFVALKKALTRSEEGQNRFNKVMEVMGAIMGRLMDIVTKLAIAIFDAFTKPKKAVKDLWEFIKSQVVVRIQSVIKLFKAFSGIISSALHLDVEGIKKNAKAAGEAFIDMNTGIENTTGKLKKAIDGQVKSVKDGIKAAEKKADFEKQYNEQYRKDIKENAKLQVEYNKQMALSEQLKRSDGEKSIAAMEKAFAAQKKIAENEFRLQQIKVNMLHEQAKESSNDIEMNKKVAEAEAELTQKRAKLDEVEMQLARRLNMVKMETLKQDRERVMAKYNLMKTELDQEKKVNAEILNDTQVSLDQKIQILADEWQQEQELNQEKFNAEKKVLDSRLKLGLINQADYDKKLQTLKAQQDTADTQARKAHEDEVTKVTIAAIKSRENNELALLNESENKKLTDLKKQLLAGEITQQEFEDRKNEIIYQSGERAIQLRMANLKKEIDAIKGNTEQKLALQQQYNELANKLDDDQTQHAIDNEEKKKQAIIDGMETAADLANHLFALDKAISDRKLAKLEEEKKAEIKAAGDNAEAKKKINEKFAKEEAKIKRKQAIADKAQSLFNIAIKTAENIVKAFPNPGLMTFAGILGALEIATVAAKPIPKFAKGTKNAPEGLAIVGEAGAEIVEQDGKTEIVEKPTLTYLKKGAKVYNSTETERIFKESGKDDYIVRDAIDRQTNNIVEAIRNKRELHINLRNGTIGEREGNYFKEYYNKKIEW